jgi:hypothetical protein
MHKGNQHIMEMNKFSEETRIPAPVYKDLASVEFSKVVKYAHDASCYIILFFAIVMYYFDIHLDKDCMLMILFLLNM